ncbi:MAG TPA: chorismate mutase [Candidatus Saccharimonadales bacterium]|jgi:chorismate mutase|nr:chorismate mutase [Candidatus Saccharimonadales bacterium]
MATRGIRGATTVERNDREQILAATRELLEVLVRLNGLRPDDVASVWFTVTPDLDAEFPAFAAREIGWTEVPLMCGREIPVPGAIAGCIRVLIDWNTAKTQREIHHAFLRRAKELRPAWAVEV